MKSLLFYTFIFALNTLGWSQSTINGMAPAFAGSRIVLSIYSDFLTEKYIDIAADTVDEKGKFTFNFDIETTERAEIRCENTITTVFIQPKTTLGVGIEPKDEKMAQIMSYIEYLAPQFIDLDPSNLNSQIIAANNLLDSFLNENKIAFLQQRIKSKMPELYTAIDSKFGQSTNLYLRDYLFYSAKELELAGGLNKLDLITTLVQNGIDFRNDACVRLLTQLFAKENTSISLSKHDEAIKDAVNKKSPIPILDSLLHLDPLLFYPKVREFVTILLLYEEFTNEEYYQESILHQLKTISKTAEYPENKLIAENLFEKLTQLRVGSKAPNFNLPSISGQRVSLKDYEGKYVLLGFWSSWSSASMAEITILESLYKRYHNDIAFIMVSTDSSMADLKRFAVSRKLTTTLLWFDNDPDVLKNYQIKAIPNFFLIDPYGNIEQSPALFPSQHLERDLIAIYNRNHPRRPLTYQWDEPEPER